MLTFPQKSSLAVSTKGAENTHSRLFVKVLFGSIRSFLFARTRSVFPVATTLVLLRAEIISLSFVPALVQPTIPTAPSPNKACVLSTCEFFGHVVAQGKTCLFKHPNSVFIYRLDFLFSRHKLFGNVYCCWLLRA